MSNPLDHLDVSSSRSSELIKPPKEHTLSSFDEVRPQSLSEIFDSFGGSQSFTVKWGFVQFYISDKSVLQCLASFSASSTERSYQSSVNSSYLTQDVDPSKRGGIFVIPLPAVYSSVDSARYASTIDTAGFSLVSGGKPSKSSS